MFTMTSNLCKITVQRSKPVRKIAALTRNFSHGVHTFSMFIGNKKKCMDTLIDDCTQKKLAKISNFFIWIDLSLSRLALHTKTSLSLSDTEIHLVNINLSFLYSIPLCSLSFSDTEIYLLV